MKRHRGSDRTCEICGARLPYYRGLSTTTCDNLCTKAKHRGTTREIETEREVMKAGSFSGIMSEHRLMSGMIRKLEPENYNQQFNA